MSFFLLVDTFVLSYMERCQTISSNQLASKQWCSLKCSLCHQITLIRTRFRSSTGLLLAEKGNTQYLWIIFGCNTKKKCESILGVCWDKSVCEWRVSFTAGWVSWCWQSHALEPSSVTLWFSVCSVKKAQCRKNYFTNKSLWNNGIIE